MKIRPNEFYLRFGVRWVFFLPFFHVFPLYCVRLFFIYLEYFEGVKLTMPIPNTHTNANDNANG